MQPYNKYYPPEYDGGSNLNVLAGKSDKGKTPVVRFALPFDVYCLNCQKRLTRGNRYNAEKEKHGDYLGIVIWKFKSKCHLCSAEFEIATDPQNASYKILSGLRRTEADLREQELQQHKQKLASETNPLALLERSVEESRSKKRDELELKSLYAKNERQWADPYAKSRELRDKHRSTRKLRLSIEKEKEEVSNKHSLSIPLLDMAPSDETSARHQFENVRGTLGNRDTLQKKMSILLDPFSGSVNTNINKKIRPFVARKPSSKQVQEDAASKTTSNSTTTTKSLIDYTDD